MAAMPAGMLSAIAISVECGGGPSHEPTSIPRRCWRPTRKSAADRGRNSKESRYRNWIRSLVVATLALLDTADKTPGSAKQKLI
jgi:hypothetical protein